MTIPLLICGLLCGLFCAIPGEYKVYCKGQRLDPNPPIIETSLVFTNSSPKSLTMLSTVSNDCEFWRLDDMDHASYIKRADLSCSQILPKFITQPRDIESILREQIDHLVRSSQLPPGSFVQGPKTASVADLIRALRSIVMKGDMEKWDFLVMAGDDPQWFTLRLNKQNRVILLEDAKNILIRSNADSDRVWENQRFRYYTRYRDGLGNGNIAIFKDLVSGCESLQPFGQADKHIWLIPSEDGHINTKDPCALREIFAGRARSPRAINESIANNCLQPWFKLRLIKKLRHDLQMLQSNNNYRSADQNFTQINLGLTNANCMIVELGLLLTWLIDQVFPPSYTVVLSKPMVDHAQMQLLLDKEKKLIILFAGEPNGPEQMILSRRRDNVKITKHICTDQTKSDDNPPLSLDLDDLRVTPLPILGPNPLVVLVENNVWLQFTDLSPGEKFYFPENDRYVYIKDSNVAYRRTRRANCNFIELPIISMLRRAMQDLYHGTGPRKTEWIGTNQQVRISWVIARNSVIINVIQWLMPQIFPSEFVLKVNNSMSMHERSSQIGLSLNGSEVLLQNHMSCEPEYYDPCLFSRYQ